MREQPPMNWFNLIVSLSDCHCISKTDLLWCLQLNMCHKELHSLIKVRLNLGGISLAPHPCSFIMSIYLCECKCYSCLCGILCLLLGPHRVNWQFCRAQQSARQVMWSGDRGWLLELLSLERSGLRGQRSWRSGAVGRQMFFFDSRESIHNLKWVGYFF